MLIHVIHVEMELLKCLLSNVMMEMVLLVMGVIQAVKLKVDIIAHEAQLVVVAHCFVVDENRLHLTLMQYMVFHKPIFLYRHQITLCEHQTQTQHIWISKMIR